MPKAKPPPLVIDLCRALVEATASGRSAYWLSVYGVRETLDVPLEALGEAVTYAVTVGLVWANEDPPRGLTVTY